MQPSEFPEDQFELLSKSLGYTTSEFKSLSYDEQLKLLDEVNQRPKVPENLDPLGSLNVKGQDSPDMNAWLPNHYRDATREKYQNTMRQLVQTDARKSAFWAIRNLLGNKNVTMGVDRLHEFEDLGRELYDQGELVANQATYDLMLAGMVALNKVRTTGRVYDEVNDLQYKLFRSWLEGNFRPHEELFKRAVKELEHRGAVNVASDYYATIFGTETWLRRLWKAGTDKNVEEDSKGWGKVAMDLLDENGGICEEWSDLYNDESGHE